MKRPRIKNLNALREQLYKDQNGLCAYCDLPLSGRFKHMEHLIPFKSCKKHDPENIYLSCQYCNAKKSWLYFHSLEHMRMFIRLWQDLGWPEEGVLVPKLIRHWLRTKAFYLQYNLFFHKVCPPYPAKMRRHPGIRIDCACMRAWAGQQKFGWTVNEIYPHLFK